MGLPEQRAESLRDFLNRANKPLIKSELKKEIEGVLPTTSVGKSTAFEAVFKIAVKEGFIIKYDAKHYVGNNFKKDKISFDSIKKSNQYAPVKFHLDSFSVSEIIALHEAGLIETPNIQRKFESWDYSDMIKLIESILLNFPIEPIYLHFKGDKYELIDGQHRVMSIIHFVKFRDFYNEVKVGDDLLSIKKTKTDTYYSFIKKAVKDFAFERISSDPNEFLFENFGPEMMRAFLSTRINAWIIKSNDSIASSIFVYLNSTGEPLLSGELIRARILESLDLPADQDIFKHVLEKTKLISYFNKGNMKKRHRYLLPSLIPQYISQLKNEEVPSFRSALNIEVKIREWVYGMSKTDIKKMVHNQNTFLDDMINSASIENIKSIQKKSQYYMHGTFFYKNRTLLNDSKIIGKFDELSEKWDSISGNKDYKNTYFSRSPISIIFSYKLSEEILLGEDKEQDEKEFLEGISSSTKNYKN